MNAGFLSGPPLRAGTIAAAAAALLLVAGCATSVKVDSLAKPNAVEKSISYKLENKNPRVTEDSLRYKEGAGFVKTALPGKGMYEAPPNTKPDVVVNLDYGIGPPQVRRETVEEPVYVEVPGAVRVE